ncbi:large conductance mechanosensitive channel protein MscL [Winogradskyella litoriviva]|uniref:Large-conductance mechanosensitive channel n=1 Tax=Winogradskyella litoriviva TaxID=1220182 RepID=A0ABX2E1C6_9FLAO|nr:large conductance mechanosensitive channel protein MscL [Winogradskyella litoriviva]NRD22265.1 large conductance mechanosensitive channel protein MscL [Winogradskyella litoriviva]
MLKEFKEFITGGNVIEFAVAVIMAGAIGGVVKGFVDNIVMPVVGYFTGGSDFSDKKVILSEAVVDAAGAVTTPENAIMWGSWVNAIINLLIVGLVMFIIVKAYNKTKAPAEEPAPAGPSELDILTEIRDALKK